MTGALYIRNTYICMKRFLLNNFRRNYLEYLDPPIFAGALILSIVFERQRVPIAEHFIAILFLTAPGYIIYHALNKKSGPPLIVFAFSIAYSILNIYAVGLISVALSHYYSIPNPLSKQTITTSLSIGYLVLTALFFSLKQKNLPFSHLRLPVLGDLHYFLHALLVVGSIIGTTLLENSVTNSLLICTYTAIFVLFVFYLFRSERTSNKYIASYLLFAGLSLLLTYSLRSNYISGYDISHEFQYFLQTKAQNNWIPQTIEDAYQACLSITLLPTVLYQISPLNEELIMKFLMIILISPIPELYSVTAFAPPTNGCAIPA